MLSNLQELQAMLARVNKEAGERERALQDEMKTCANFIAASVLRLLLCSLRDKYREAEVRNEVRSSKPFLSIQCVFDPTGIGVCCPRGYSSSASVLEHSMFCPSNEMLSCEQANRFAARIDGRARGSLGQRREVNSSIFS